MIVAVIAAITRSHHCISMMATTTGPPTKQAMSIQAAMRCEMDTGVGWPPSGDGGRLERPEWDSNPRTTDLQSAPLGHFGIRPDAG